MSRGDPVRGPDRPAIRRGEAAAESHTEERCHIRELSNTATDAAVSIAQARVSPGTVTRWHRLAGIAERYVVLRGQGRVELEGLPPQFLMPGDVALIPAGCAQRIANTGGDDLVFLAICTPRFVPEAYEDIDPDPPAERLA